MRIFLLLFLLASFCACTPEIIEPLAEKESIYYLVIRFDDGEDEDLIKSAIDNQLAPFGNFRVSSLYFGVSKDEPAMTVRRCHSLRTGKRLVRALRKDVLFKGREMKVVSQLQYREMLKRRTFY